MNKNTLLFIGSVILITLVFMTEFGAWSVLAFWINAIILLLSVLLIYFAVFPGPGWLYRVFRDKWSFVPLISWFAVFALYFLIYILFGLYYEALGQIAGLREGLVDLSFLGYFVPAIVTVLGVFVLTFEAVFGKKKY